MSYVVQNFYFSEKRIVLNFRIKYYLLLTHNFLSQVLLKFCLSHKHLIWYVYQSSLIFLFLKHVTFYKPYFFLYYDTLHKPRNYTNNLYLSTIYWRLRRLTFFDSSYSSNFQRMMTVDRCWQFWTPIKLNSSEVQKNFYDRIIYFYFLKNHFAWPDVSHKYNLTASYSFIKFYMKSNVFINTLFFPIYNF